ncbi:hypothetical protein SAMN06265360_106142 [Haloechinothrix alba]|uniref:Uncharacterized protein n=1 Tax=Haloechinothrix alba TaxID=664784 RepID=A0A238WGV2_9PSEU|nr:hypothetical protein SAMN06265360_106142 [Haloechinothrix alba]
MVGQFERNKDTVQEITESAATHVGNIASIITSAVRDITREIGDGISEAVEMYEASQRAKEDGGDESPGQRLRGDHEVTPKPVIDPDTEQR